MIAINEARIPVSTLADLNTLDEAEIVEGTTTAGSKSRAATIAVAPIGTAGGTE